MPIPSASSKIFWPYSYIFDCVPIFLTVVKSDILPYKFAYLSMVKNIWPHSNILNAANFVFELADGIGKKNTSLFSFGFKPTSILIFRTKTSIQKTTLTTLIKSEFSDWNFQWTKSVQKKTVEKEKLWKETKNVLKQQFYSRKLHKRYGWNIFRRLGTYLQKIHIASNDTFWHGF